APHCIRTLPRSKAPDAPYLAVAMDLRSLDTSDRTLAGDRDSPSPDPYAAPSSERILANRPHTESSWRCCRRRRFPPQSRRKLWGPKHVLASSDWNGWKRRILVHEVWRVPDHQDVDTP